MNTKMLPQWRESTSQSFILAVRFLNHPLVNYKDLTAPHHQEICWEAT
jgi:hypothetical protein